MTIETDTAGSKELYDHAWYRDRAFKSLRQIGKGVWDFSDSLLLFYSEESEDDYEIIQQGDNPYFQLVTKPEREFLEAIAEAIARELPEDFDYVDLGPGTEHKEQYIFDALKARNKHFVYKPVDISKKFLNLAAAHARSQGLTVEPVHATFEELSRKLSPSHRPRFVSLGLTYGNYHPSEALAMLKDISGHNGMAFVDSQLRERVNIDAIAAIYEADVYKIAEPKVKLLGLDPKRDVAQHLCDDGIRAWVVLKNSFPQLMRVGIKSGARLMVLQSLRPTLESFERDISSKFASHILLDVGGPFAGAILKS